MRNTTFGNVISILFERHMYAIYRPQLCYLHIISGIFTRRKWLAQTLGAVKHSPYGKPCQGSGL